jgi:hypothetical protein
MSAIFSTTRLSRVALLAVTGATALSVAACGSSNEAKPTSANPTSSAAPTSSTPSASGKAKDWVNGLIDSVSGSTIQVSQRSGTATVDFTPSTAVSETTPAQLTDITAGSCVSIRPDRHGASSEGGAITARSVRVSTAVDGKCPTPTHPAGEGSRHQPPHGQVASVTGNTITLNSADAQGNPAQTSVTITDTTTYTKQTATDANAIVQGKCIAAHGTRDSGGALQATNISVQPADNGNCPEPGGKHHRH